MKNILAICFALATSTAFSQHNEIHCYYHDHGAHERDRNIDIDHMKLEVSFEPAIKKVTGKVTHTFHCLQDNIDTIFLDGPGIQVSKATLDGNAIETSSNQNGIVCYTKITKAYQTSHTLVLEYTATPKKGIYFIGWNQNNISDPATMTRKQIWTQGQGIDNRHWIPMIDDRGDKFVTEVVVKFDKDYKVLSNGDCILNKENKDGTRTWHYKINHQHAGYLLMLAIDKYAIKSTKTSRGTPIHFWYYPEHPERVEATSLHSEKIIEFLEDETGVKYPWGSYSQVMIQDFLYGAMENTTATTFGDFFWVDNRAFLDRNYIGVNAHEATHQWFGDLITSRNDADHWLQESFATYYPGLFMGSVYGNDEQTWYFRGQMNGALAAGAANNLPVAHSQAGSGRHYPKGASVLYMLQHIMGRENFNRGIKTYLDRYAFQGVVTEDLEKAMMDATGMNMDWFFDQWIHRGGEPIYNVSWKNLNKATEIQITQKQSFDPTVEYFSMPVDFAVYYTDGTVDRKTAIVSGAYTSVEIANPNSKTVDFILFDEGSFILKKVNFEKTTAQYLSQLEKASFTIDRYDALLALSKLPIEQKRDALIKAYSRETYKQMLAEIAKQLTLAGDFSFMQRAANSKHVDVRKAVISNAPLNSETLTLFENALTDSSYALIETALLKLWEYAPAFDKRLTYLEKIQHLNGYTMNLKIRYLELACEIFPDMKKQNIGILSDFTSDLYEFRTRINAMQALQRLNACNTQIVKNLFSCLLNFNSRLNNPAKDVLMYFKEQTAYARMIKETLNDDGYTAEQKKHIRQMLGL